MDLLLITFDTALRSDTFALVVSWLAYVGVTTLLLVFIYLTLEVTVSSFLKDLAERAVKTFVQVFLAAVPAGSIFNLNVSAVKGAALAAGAAVLSLVTSAISKKFGNSDTASLVDKAPEA